MAIKIDDEMLDYVSILAKLELKGEERERVRSDMERILDHVDLLNELDTEEVKPLVQAVELQNVFREDAVTNTDSREDMMRNAPEQKDGQYVVPRTF